MKESDTSHPPRLVGGGGPGVVGSGLGMDEREERLTWSLYTYELFDLLLQ